MRTNILGYPRIGSRHEPKKACESFRAGKITLYSVVAREP